MLRRFSILYAFLLLAALGMLWWGLGFASREKANRQHVNEGGRTSEEQQNTPPDDRGEPPASTQEPQENTSKSTLLSGARLLAVQKIDADSAAILPEGAAHNAITRIWAADETGMYVEYKREGQSTADRMAFFELNGTSFSSTALYGQSGAGGWELLGGDDVLFTRPLKDLYEKNAQRQWVKTN